MTSIRMPIKILHELETVIENDAPVDRKLFNHAVKTFNTLSSSNTSTALGEAIPCALLIVLAVDRDKSYNENGIFGKVLNSDILSRQKFVCAASNKEASLIPLLISKIVRTTSSIPKSYLILLSTAIFWPIYEVRREALKVVKEQISGNVTLSCELLQVILTSLQNDFLDNVVKKLKKQMSATDSNKLNSGVLGREVCQFMRVILQTDNKRPDAQMNGVIEFFISSLLVCSLERTVQYNGSIWIEWIHKESAYAKILKQPEHCAQIVQSIFDRNCNIDCCANAVKLLVSLGSNIGHTISHAVWKHCGSLLHSIDMEKCINVDPKDVGVFYTSEGILFNTDIIEQNADDAIIAKNIKRESKTYSYKEQMAELQLRKELAEKNRREGKLTERQKKAIAEELKREELVRASLRELYYNISDRMKIVSVAVRYNPSGAFDNIELLYDVIIPLLKSKIVSKLAVDAFLSFRDAFFDPSSDYLHELVAHISLRVLGSEYLFKNWCEESLESQLKRTFTLLASSCLLFSMIEEETDDAMKDPEDDDLLNEGITAGKLAFIVPLLEKIFFVADVKKTVKLAAEVTDSNLQMRVAAFLKVAISPNFIFNSDVTSLPILRLNSVLLRAIIGCQNAFNFIDDAVTTLNGYCSMLNSNNAHLNDGVLAFIQLILSCFHEKEELIRRHSITLLHNVKQLFIEIFVEKSNFKNEVRHCVYLARHDSAEDCAVAADTLWLLLRFDTFPDFCYSFIDDLSSENAIIRDEAAGSIWELIEEYPSEFEKMIGRLAERYVELNKLQPIYDAIGRKERDFDDWVNRSSIANTFCLLAESVPTNLLMKFIKIVVPDGLNDRNDACRDFMRHAGVISIANHGKDIIDELLPFLETCLDKIPQSLAELDNLRQGLVILIGTLARHLENSENKIRAIAARLIEALSTPSEPVQQSVASCLPALMPSLRSYAKEMVQNLMILLTNADTYGERRGAAYGIASIVKGLGVATIKEMEISTSLKKLLTSRENPMHREGALLCFEMMCSIIGKLFEPYVIQLLPDLLNMFGDLNDSVRRAADDTARALMRALSAPGVKLILPSLLCALEQDSWRTKCASAELLGAMSNCAPRQLSACLPSIVPRICDVLLADTHSKVQKTGEKALKQIAKVIQNPEILAISSHLITGLVDPATKTKAALEIIVNTKFLHYVDSPSLALIMPIIRRAFNERNTDTRRMAAQIVANIYSLADYKDMEPYLQELLPGLKNAMVDPSPEVRSVASKALGSIIRYSSPITSERLQSEIMPWLKESLVSKTSMVDRSGAAQSLSEMIAALGDEFLSNNMPSVIKMTENPNTEPHIRDGYILLYIYLPIVLEDKFIPYIAQIVPSILKALADETEYVRDSALKAGQRLISTYISQAKKLLIPQLQTAMLDGNWRIRQASIKLIGEFLFSISGVSGKMTSDTQNEDDTLGIETVNKAIVRHVGQKCRDDIFAALYLLRHDVALVVRQSANHVWKVVVTNTPRTLKELMKTLLELVLQCLSSNVHDRQQMAARCLGEMVKKMGERILTTVLPLLEKRLVSKEVEPRRGVAIALNEILGNTHRDVMEMYALTVVSAIRKCLSDSEKSVRDAIVSAFASFYHMVPHVAVEEIIAPMIDSYSSTQGEDVLDGLCLVIGDSTNRSLLSNVLPKLTKPPVNSLALCRLASVAEDSLSRNLPRILDALLSDNLLTTLEEHVSNSIPLLLSIEDEDDVQTVVTTMLKHSSANSKTALMLLKEFINQTDADLTDLFEDLFTGLLFLYNNDDETMVETAIETIQFLVKHTESECLIDLVLPIKRAAHSVYVKFEKRMKNANAEEPGTSFIRGLGNPKGWQPLLAILREGFLSGPPETKEIAGIAMGELVALSSAKGLGPHVINMAGPLIRVLGDRHPAHVKLAVLNSLLKLLDKLPLMLRPFLPQMQSVFLRILQEHVSGNIRAASLTALEKIIEFHPKPDAVIKELQKIQGSENNAVDIDDLIADLQSKINAKADEN